jgi:argininosuccinate lyase
MPQKQWGGRFGEATDKRVESFTESVSFDRRLYRQDIQASQAHARMLAKVGLLTTDETQKICASLDRLLKKIESGQLEYTTALEDIHTHIEQALIADLGDLGRKLHTGRSRNDQVATDVKLWVREAIDEMDRLIKDLQTAFVESAIRERDVILPGYTHLQRAQPVLAAHYYLAYVEKFQRDRERFLDGRKRVNVLPLGTAALAGTSLPIDREYVAKELGFDSVARNSLDVSSDRDFLLEYVFDLAMVSLHLSGWAEEWIIWSTTEFGFLELPDEFCTGSSVMPHKKNPDALELIRGKSARAVAALNGLMILVKGLPLAYNRDLQEDKVALFDCHDTVASCLLIAAAMVRAARLRRDVVASGLEKGFLDATTLMELLVARGLPMRSAHEAVGKLVRLGEQRGCSLAELPTAEFDSIQSGLSSAVYEVLGVPRALAAFRSYGSTAPAEVDRQLKDWRSWLGLEVK